MSRQYSLPSFLRHAPNELVRQYLARLSVGADLAWEELSETQTKPIMSEIDSVPEHVRAQIDSEFREMQAMATEGGLKTLIEEAKHPRHGLDITDTLGAMDSPYDAAMWVFLEHPTVFAIALLFDHADGLPGRSWRKRSHLPGATPRTDEASRQALEDELSAYYREREGRGNVCRVEHYRRDSRLYWFCYPEDYASVTMEYAEGGEFSRRRQRPAFEVIFVYDTAERSLDTFARGPKRQVQELRELWARTILGEALGGPEDKGVVYELNPLLSRDFPMPLDPRDGIDDVRVRKLRLSVFGEHNKRITLEANVRDRGEAVYDLLDGVLAGGAIRARLVNVTQASIQFIFRPDKGNRPKVVTCDITYPDSCGLKYGGENDIARAYLRKRGLDVSGDPPADPDWG